MLVLETGGLLPTEHRILKKCEPLILASLSLEGRVG